MLKVNYKTEANGKKRVTYFESFGQLSDYAVKQQEMDGKFILLKAKKLTTLTEIWNSLCRKMMIGPKPVKEVNLAEEKVMDSSEMFVMHLDQSIPTLFENLNIRKEQELISKIPDHGEYNAKEGESTQA